MRVLFASGPLIVQASEVGLGAVFPALAHLSLSTRYTVSYESVKRIPAQLFTPEAPLPCLRHLHL